MTFEEIVPIFIGMLGMMMLYVGLQSFFLRDKAYLFYFLYILAWIFFFLFHNTNVYHLFGENTPLSQFFFIFHRVGFPMFSYIAYFWFSDALMDLHKEFPVFWKYAGFAQKLLWVYIIFMLIISAFSIDLNYTFYFEIIHTFVRISLAIVATIGIVKVYQKRNRLGHLYVTGSALLIFFGVMAMVFSFFMKQDLKYFWEAPLFYQQIGIILELLFFSIALSYKNKRTEIQKISTEQMLNLEREQREIELLRIALEKQQVVEQERNRISKDMHDDLGSGLTKIAILSEVAKRQRGQTLDNQLSKISESARELVDNLNQIIWTLNPHNDNLESLSAYIREYASKFLDTFEIDSSFDFPVKIDSISLPEHTRRNIFLVTKESLNNIVKHAKATQVKIRLSVGKDDFSLQILDNGIGFDSSHTRKFGNGLKNMEKRMEEIGGKFEVSSLPCNGTLLKFTTFM